MGLITVPSELCTLAYRKAGEWKIIPGINSYRESGGEPPERDDVAFEGASKRTGHPRVPSIECPAFYQPLHQAWQDLYQYALNKTIVVFRLQTPEEPVFNTNAITAAIATSGVVTLAVKSSTQGMVPDLKERHFGPGLSLKFAAAQDSGAGGGNTKYWHIESITKTGIATVSPAPKAAIAAADLDASEAPNPGAIVLAGTQRGTQGFPATVRLAGLMELSAESSAQTTLTLAPRGALPAFVPVAA